MGNAFCFKMLQNSYQKTRMFFDVSGCRNIRKQITFFSEDPRLFEKKNKKKVVRLANASFVVRQRTHLAMKMTAIHGS